LVHPLRDVGPLLPVWRLSEWPSQVIRSSAPVTLACSLRNPSVGHRPAFGESPLRVTRFVGGRYLGAALSGCRPVGNGSAFHPSPLRLRSSSADCQAVSHPLRNNDRSCQLGSLRGYLLRQSVRRPPSPWRLSCETRQSVTGPLSAGLPCGSPAYQRPLPW